jgi:hypothetical protein
LNECVCSALDTASDCAIVTAVARQYVLPKAIVLVVASSAAVVTASCCNLLVCQCHYCNCAATTTTAAAPLCDYKCYVQLLLFGEYNESNCCYCDAIATATAIGVYTVYHAAAAAAAARTTAAAAAAIE